MLQKITKKNKELICKIIKFKNNSFSKGIGLMFHKRIIDEAHIFIFNKKRKVTLTMWFVFFSIDVIFLDENKKIVELKENFKPFTNYYPKCESSFVVELPLGTIKKKNLKKQDKLDF
ncbi:MAG: DUF192 domain-containing protein [Candidatus Woesearchaeota archaeon]|jgi:hypothetical protein